MNQLNLALHRSNESVWDRPGWRRTGNTAVGRCLVAGAGTAAAIEAARRGGPLGWSLAVAAGAAAVWAALPDRTRLNVSCRLADMRDRRPWRRDIVADASAESFPASDPPAFTSTLGPVGARRAR